jgi:predicted secreted hydrolase
MLRKYLCVVAAGLLATAALAAEAPVEYPPVTPGYALAFPRDHGAHPMFRTEWWYLTGHVADARGKAYGFQITFFRTRTGIGEDSTSRFAPSQLIMAHAAVSDVEHGKLHHDQRIARAGPGLAHAREGATDVLLDNWSLKQTPRGFSAAVAARGFALDLVFAATLKPVLHGQAGFSQKGPERRHASYYYSLPQLDVTGTAAIGGDALAVTGRAWMDHEWSSQAIMPEAAGWDWIGVNLDDGGALMAFRMRGKDGMALWSAGTWLRPGAGAVAYAQGEIEFIPAATWQSPRTQVTYPVAMDVRTGNTLWRLSPLMPDQELDSRASTGTIYWEGAVTASREGRVAGRGYLELTGYGKPIRF